MPAAAVIPAPIAYIKVVAVKKFVVEFLSAAAVRLTVCLVRAQTLRRRRVAFTGRALDPHQLL